MTRSSRLLAVTIGAGLLAAGVPFDLGFALGCHLVERRELWGRA